MILLESYNLIYKKNNLSFKIMEFEQVQKIPISSQYQEISISLQNMCHKI